MYSRVLRLIFASLVSLAIPSTAAAKDLKEAVRSCYKAKVSKLISTESRDYSSPQFRIVCQYRDVGKREKNETFTYYPPNGFKIISADVEVVLKSSRTSISDLKFQGQKATVNLQCKGRPEDELVHDAVAVKIVGRLEYVPTPQDTNSITSVCLDQATTR